MNVKLRVLSIGVLFFAGHSVMAQKAKRDTATKTTEIAEVVLVGGVKLDPAQKVGSYSVVSKANFESTPFSTVDEVLNGRVAGLNFSAASGDPGSPLAEEKFKPATLPFSTSSTDENGVDSKFAFETVLYAPTF